MGEKTKEDVDSGSRLLKKKVAVNVSSIFDARHAPYLEEDFVPTSESDKPSSSYEEHLIIRFPKNIANDIQSAIKDGSIHSRLSFLFSSDRLGLLKFDEKTYKTTIVDLPSIIETLKTFDEKQFYKITDISQMILVDDETDFYRQNYFLDVSSFDYPHGLTPPLTYVRSRRFRKTPLDSKEHTDYIRNLETEALKIIQRDVAAFQTSFEVRDENGSILVNENTLKDYDTSSLVGAEDPNVPSEDEDSDFAAEVENTLSQPPLL